MSRLFVAALLGALVLAPLGLAPYFLALLTQSVILAVFAMSLDLVLGYLGLPSLGHAAFFGAAAYTVALLWTHYALPFWPTVGLALGVAVALSAFFALLVLRSQGSYFLMITLALGQVLWGIAIGWRSVTRGDDGLPGIPRPQLGLPWSLADPVVFYYATLAVAALAAWGMWRLVRSPLGLAAQGVRENATRLRVLGYNVALCKYLMLLLAGSFAGVAGVLWVYFSGFVSPVDLSLVRSAEALLMVILGGPGTLFGPALGAGLLVWLENVISAYTERWPFVLGAIYVAVVLLAPRGLVGALRARWEKG